MPNNLIYVYCISSSLPEPNLNFDCEELKFLVFNGFWVTVKNVSDSEFSEENLKKKLSDIQWVESNAREHIKVISTIMKYSTVIPFKFGTIYNTKNSLKKFITDYSTSLTENFHNIKGKEEWSVKIYCNRKVLNKQIDELSEDAAELEKQIMASSPGKAYILSRKKTDMVENEMDRLCNNYGQEYYNKFESLSELTSRNNLLPKEITGKDHSMILNATFLVSKTKASEFVLTVDSLTKESINNGFIIEATGPWPPFSFISIKEKL